MRRSSGGRSIAGPMANLLRVARVALIAVGSVVVGAGCDDEPEVLLGPPRCEPAQELEVERGLKVGFRALFEGDAARAKASFEAVERDEPGHPEAALGLRLATRAGGGGKTVAPSSEGKDSASEGDGASALVPGAELAIVVAGRRVPFSLPVVTERHRFEEVAAMMPLRKARDGVGATAELFRTRTRSGVAVAPEDFNAVRGSIDLIVLHDTGTADVRESMVSMEGSGASTHFIIEWDGTIYQTLDLALEANHSQTSADAGARDSSIDGRSIAIDLVNPVSLDKSPGLPDGRAGVAERPRSEAVALQGEQVQQWGYTPAQIDAVERLVAALLREFPQVAARVPQVGGDVPRHVFEGAASFTGVLGHLHLTRVAKDPGAAFPWERIAKALTKAR